MPADVSSNFIMPSLGALVALLDAPSLNVKLTHYLFLIVAESYLDAVIRLL